MGRVTLAAVGDISFCGNLMMERIAAEGAGFPFEHVIASLKAADVRFGNQESVLTPADFPADKLPGRALQSPDVAAASLALVGFDVMHAASNHVLDCGSRGLASTCARLRAMGTQPLGADPDPAEARAMRVVERNGLRIGFLGYLEPCNWVLRGGGGKVSLFDPAGACADIARCRGHVDTLVVSLHADLEFRLGPSVPRVKACRAMVEAGADLVLCHHPHVPQGIERWGGGLIAYSLGNFVFPCGTYLRNCGGPHVTRATILHVDLVDGRVGPFRRESFRIDPDEGRPYPLTADGRAEADAHHAMLDAIVADPDRLREVWYESCQVYLKTAWPQIVKAGPEGFVDQVGWRLLALDENANWVAGILEMARRRYAGNSRGDFEFTRPNSPFEV
ncbi:MAG: CapA family protein [Planctomycetes bacterium]|nr:CapA family protein [Planctomycetota bacterium]